MSLSEPHNKLYISLFALIQQTFNERVSVIQCTKSALVHLSHVLEDVVLKQRIPAILLTGFQESSHWRKETERYRELAGIAKQVYIFAGRPLPPDSASKVVQITLGDDDPLRQEWFVLILSQPFSALLCGRDRLEDVIEESSRVFDTILSFDHRIILETIAVLEQALHHYRPDLIDVLKPYIHGLDPTSTNLLPIVINEMMHFEEQLLSKTMNANRALQRERDFNRQLIDATPSFLLTVDTQWRVQSVNPAFLEHFKVDRSAVLGQSIAQFVQADYIPRLETFLAQVLTGDSQEVIVVKMATPETLSLVEWRASPLISALDNAPLLLLMGLDITARYALEQVRQSEAYLRGQLEREQQLNHVKSQILLTISHEFRTPLTIIQSSSELLGLYADRLSETARKERLERIRQQIDYLSSMLTDLTLIIQVEEKHLQFHPQPTVVESFLRNLLSDIQNNHYPLVTAYYVSDLPADLVLPLDTRLLQHIVGNLLSNAFKYSPNGGRVWLRARLDGDRLLLEVEDEGIGIPAQDQARLFQAFERGSNVDTISGTGLGLRIVKDCVDLWGGHIRYQSAEGEGTIMQVWLPVLGVMPS